mgnify:CR=1 FL=1|jgi:hypothetical protein|tara:strand:- start:15 stop:824 length:810 start_codon:yes stop_codon:yes gene_type:complete
MIDIINTKKYDRLKKVKLGKLKDSWSHDLRPNPIKKIIHILRTILLLNFFKKRKENKLKNNIIKEGYNPEKYSYVLISEDDPNTTTPYRVKDGNHRVKILKELYGEDYEISVMESLGQFEEKKENNVLEDILEGLAHLPVILIPSMIFFVWYMLVELLIVSLVCYFFMMYVKDIRNKATTDQHPKKYLSFIYNKSKPLYETLMTIYYNFRMIGLGGIIIVYSYHILTTHTIGFLILIGVSVVVKVIVDTLFDETHISFPKILKILKSNK